MKKLFVIIFFILGFFSFAQSIKSLRQDGLKAINNNDFSTAKGYYTKLLEKGYKTWETYVFMGDCEFNLGNIDEALTNFELAQKKADVRYQATIYIRIGTIFMQQKKYEEAWMQFLKIEITRPNDIVAKKLQTTALYQMGKYKEALSTLNSAEKLDDSDLEIKYYKGMALVKLDKIEEACQNLEQVKSLDLPDIKILLAQHCHKP